MCFSNIFFPYLKVSSSGTLTGGYFKNMRSKLEIQKQRNDSISQIKEAEEVLAVLKTQLNEVEVNVNVVMSDMQKTETKNSKSKYVFSY